jgi:hypothetical protein
MIVWSEDVTYFDYDKCLCKCYMRGEYLEWGECLRNCYMIVRGREGKYLKNAQVIVTW